MTDVERGIRQERDFFLECLLVLRQCLLRIGSQFLGIFLFLLLLLLLAQQLTSGHRAIELFIYLLEERHMIVELDQIERTVEGQLAMRINGIAIGVAILIFHASLPRIVGTIRSIGVHPVENRQQVERHLIGSRKTLTIIERSTPGSDTIEHGTSVYRILPGMILISIKIRIHIRIWHIYLCMGSTLEVHVKIPGQVPTQSKFTVPKELIAECNRQLRLGKTFHITLLQFIGFMSHLGIESEILRQPVQPETLQDVEPLTLVLDFLKRFPGLIYRSP